MEQEKNENDKVYLIKDGKQVMSVWKFFTETGTVDRLNLSPTQSFELLKQQRNESYPTVKQKFIDERVMNDLITTDFELNQFRIAWLNKELIAVERWLSDSRSTSDQIEILKYRTFCQEEIDSLLKLVNEKQKPHHEKKKPVLKDFFNNDVSEKTIVSIQAEFKQLDGKDLAILIYLLHKEHQLIEVLTNSKTKGRKGFVKCLTEIDEPEMQKVNKCFQPNTDDLNYSKDDLVFRSLNEKLTKMIKNTVV